MDRYETHIIRCLENAIEGVGICSEVSISSSVLHGAIKLLKEKPQIVRCKDCKYWQTNTQFCTRWSAPFATQHTSPNWYCADAERKDGDDNG